MTINKIVLDQSAQSSVLSGRTSAPAIVRSTWLLGQVYHVIGPQMYVLVPFSYNPLCKKA